MTNLEIASVEERNPTNKTSQQLVGGYVEFSLGEFTHEHFFTSPHELIQVNDFIDRAKPVQGLMQFIRHRYTSRVSEKHPVAEPEVFIWNYELEWKNTNG